jgi:hypothetical protein
MSSFSFSCLFPSWFSPPSKPPDNNTRAKRQGDTNKMELDVIDPLDWTVDQVVAFLCRNPLTPWSQSANPPPRPYPNAFETALTENLINGEMLLNHVNDVFLRKDLGLKALGHRGTVLDAIHYLQQRSVKYRRANSAKPDALPQGKLLSFIPY